MSNLVDWRSELIEGGGGDTPLVDWREEHELLAGGGGGGNTPLVDWREEHELLAGGGSGNTPLVTN